jgi:hypothetical protein
VSKKRVNEGLIDSAISSIFGAIGRGIGDRTLKILAKKDPKIAQSLKQAEDARKILKTRLDAMSKKDKRDLKKGKYFDL